MQYRIEIEKKSVKFISKQPKQQREQILKAIYHLPNGDIKIIQGHIGYYRLRIGDYRVIYTIDDNVLVIKVVEVGNRGDIYNRL